MPSWTAVRSSITRRNKRKSKGDINSAIERNETRDRTTAPESTANGSMTISQKVRLYYADGEIGLSVSLPFHFLTDERKLFLAFLLGGGELSLIFRHCTLLRSTDFHHCTTADGRLQESIKLRHDPADHAGAYRYMLRSGGRQGSGRRTRWRPWSTACSECSGTGRKYP